MAYFYRLPDGRQHQLLQITELELENLRAIYPLAGVPVYFCEGYMRRPTGELTDFRVRNVWPAAGVLGGQLVREDISGVTAPT